MRKYPNHIQYIIDNYSRELLARLKGEARDITVESALDTLLCCDPSEHKKFTDWLVKTYYSKGFRWEDVEAGAASKLAEVLGLYQTHFNQISRDQRNIYQYQSYGELYALVKPYVIEISENQDTLGSREIKRRERARALEESEVLFRSEELIIAVPLTETAAVWWGRGTKWCTSADKNNYFNHYNKHAPLIVITLLSKIKGENTEKFQLWAYNDDVQFMDSSDCEVDNQIIEKYWNFFQPILNVMIKQNAHILNYIPYQFRSLDLCTRAIEQSGYFLRSTPDQFKTPELCCFAVNNYGNALSYVPAKLINYNICRQAVEQNGRSLGMVPRKLRTAELCKLAVEQNGYAISYVPQELKTIDLFKLAVRVTPQTLRLIPQEIAAIDHSFYLIAVEKDPMMLFYVPECFRTNEMCCAAVQKEGKSIAYVPEKYQTDLLKEQAIKQNGLALGSIRLEFRTFDLCKMAIEQTSDARRYIPLEFEAEEFKLLSIIDSIETDPNKEWDQTLIDELKESLTHAFSSSPLDNALYLPVPNIN